MHDFDIILGMNWLSSNHAYIDCFGKRVVFQISDEPQFFFQGEAHNAKSKQFKPSSSIISVMNARKALRKGCKTFLAYVVNAQKEKIELDDIPIVKEFSDVFSDELSRLSPDCEVEFKIDITSGIGSISKPPYRMASAELCELKIQL